MVRGGLIIGLRSTSSTHHPAGIGLPSITLTMVEVGVSEVSSKPACSSSMFWREAGEGYSRARRFRKANPARSKHAGSRPERPWRNGDEHPLNA